MYEYQYIPLHVGGGLFVNNADKEHQEIINREAENGWRYVGYIPIDFSGKGSPLHIDLIFERPVEK